MSPKRAHSDSDSVDHTIDMTGLEPSDSEDRMKLTTLDSAMRVKMLVDEADVLTFDLTTALDVYNPRNGVPSTQRNHASHAGKIASGC